jgi:type II secretory pathway pseudopilin PulG
MQASLAHPPAQKPAITLVELLVVLMIVAILVALLLPAVQTTGGGHWRRTECRNNLHQLGLALHQYHDMYGCFPPAVTTDAAGEPMHSWTVHLLPFLDEWRLYNSYNFAVAWDHAANTTVGSASLAQFQCPSVFGPNMNDTHYGMVVCPDSICGVDRSMRIKDIADGTGQTLVMAEMSRTACPWTKPAAIVNLRRGFNVPLGYPQGASSAHEVGLFVLFADGHVRCLGNDIDASTLQSLCTANGNEAVDDEDF